MIADGQGRRRHGRIARHRQLAQRKAAAEQDDQRDDPGKDRTVDKELGEHGAYFFASSLDSLSGAGQALRRQQRRPGVPEYRLDDGARPGLLQAIDDDLFAGLEPFGDDEIGPGHAADLYRARLHLALGIDHHHDLTLRRRPAPPVAERGSRCRVWACGKRTRTKVPGSSSRRELGNSARKQHRTGARINRQIGETQASFFRIDRPVLEQQLNLGGIWLFFCLPLLTACCRRSRSEYDWVNSTRIGSSCSTVTRCVASPLPTKRALGHQRTAGATGNWR